MTTPSVASRGRHPSGLARVTPSFANDSERIFAQLLTLYGIAWSYEPVEFPLAWTETGEVARAFRPDFYLEETNCFVELTVLEQRLVTKKNRKIRDFRALYPEVDLRVVYRRDFTALIEGHELGDLSVFHPTTA